jgi:hypothetical protein
LSLIFLLLFVAFSFHYVSATGYGLDNRGVGIRVPVWSRIFSFPSRRNRLWDPPNLLSNGYWGPFPRGYSGRT